MNENLLQVKNDSNIQVPVPNVIKEVLNEVDFLVNFFEFIKQFPSLGSKL